VSGIGSHFDGFSYRKLTTLFKLITGFYCSFPQKNDILSRIQLTTKLFEDWKASVQKWNLIPLLPDNVGVDIVPGLEVSRRRPPAIDYSKIPVGSFFDYEQPFLRKAYDFAVARPTVQMRLD
jgi:hypothetical protein